MLLLLLFRNNLRILVLIFIKELRLRYRFKRYLKEILLELLIEFNKLKFNFLFTTLNSSHIFSGTLLYKLLFLAQYSKSCIQK
jgi:hypothetical protein